MNEHIIINHVVLNARELLHSDLFVLNGKLSQLDATDVLNSYKIGVHKFEVNYSSITNQIKTEGFLTPFYI